MLKTAYILILMLVLCQLSLSAQTDEEWYLNVIITEIRFEGLQAVSENDVQGVVTPFIGSAFTETILNDLQRRLYNLEYFDLLVPEALPGNDERSELILKFTVEERSTISEIQFSGNQQLRRGTISDAILLSVGDFVSQIKARTDQEVIVSLYKERGFADVEVSFRLDDADEINSQRLVFVINEGPQTNVRSIRFSGINFATENQLWPILETKQQGLFSPGTFQLANLDLDRQAIVKFYADNGYVDAQVLNIERTVITEEESNRQFLEITYFIDEGIPWLFGGVSFEGNTIFTAEEMRSRIFLEEGRVLNLSLLQQGFQAVSDLYYQGGYIFNQIDLQESRDEALQQITYTIQIVEQGRAYIENIVIRGNTKTKDDVILREFSFEEGDIFSASRIRDGIGNLYNTQYFADVPAIDTPQGSEAGLMDLIINLEEGETTDIRLGFTVGGGGEFPISGLVKWADTNFLGNGQTLGADLNISPIEQSIKVNFYDGWLFGPRWSGGASLQVTRSVQNNELQDILYPVFDTFVDSQGKLSVPDPFQGYYVFGRDTSYNGADYKAGEVFPGVPSNTDIITYNLQTDYGYFLSRGGSSSSIADEYKMEYVQWNIAASVSTGILRPSVIGWLGAQAALTVSFNHVDYDASLYRPFNEGVRTNLGVLKVINSLSLSAKIDGRDVFFNTQNGYLLEQAITYAGGFLGGARNYIRTDTTLQGYLTLFDLEVSPAWSWKMILAANVGLSFMLDQFFVYEGAGKFEAAGRLLRTNSMTVARGWPARSNGQALFNSWIELRMPLAEKILWFDMYTEAVRITEDREIFAPGFDNWLFGFGAGLRFTIQQFPFRIYLSKRFRVEDGAVKWQGGNLFADPANAESGVDLIFAISL